MNKKEIDEIIWTKVKRKYRLSNITIQMAKQLGLNPKKFGKLANHKQEHWKEPLPNFIQTLYEKRFGKLDVKEKINPYGH